MGQKILKATWTSQVCRIVVFWAAFQAFWYMLLGSRYSFERGVKQSTNSLAPGSYTYSMRAIGSNEFNKTCATGPGCFQKTRAPIGFGQKCSMYDLPFVRKRTWGLLVNLAPSTSGVGHENSLRTARSPLLFRSDNDNL